jgi:uncharacterized protein (TIGR03437 family)
MAWDGNSQGILLFGGNVGGNISTGETWLWNGTDWSLLAPANAPPARYGGEMVWDSSKKKVVLFGGHTGGTPDVLFNDTWLWDGTNWTMATTAASPSQRYNAGMTFDAAHSQTVLFGGNPGGTAAGTGATNAETWTFDGTNWTQQSPATSPTARNSAGLTYDPQHSQVVLFGGTAINSAGTGTAVNAETWIWNGSAWNQQTLTTSPDPRTGTLIYDATNNQIFLWGGNGQGDFVDVWTWDGASPSGWTNKIPNNRYGANLVYDTADQKGWLMAGTNGNAGNTRYQDIWAWNGTGWTSTPYTGQTAKPRYFGSAAYDPVVDAVIVFGGINGTGTASQVGANMWTWSAASALWSSAKATATPAAGTRTGNAMAYVPTAIPPGSMIFGGASMSSTVGSGTYLWDSSKNALTAVTAPGPPARTGAVMVYDSVHQQLVMFGGTSNTTTQAGTDFGDTWIGTWSGVTAGAFSWTQAVPATNPPARAFHSMAFDGTYTWMTGGMTNATQTGAPAAGKTPTYYSDLWYWDGTNWNQATTPATGPAPSMGMSMAFDANHGASAPGGQGQLVLFGGDYITGTTTHNPSANTWVWGTADAGSIGVNTYTVQNGAIAPVTGATFTLSGPCTISDPLPCTKNPRLNGPTVSLTAQPPGYYSVVYGALAGYSTPATQNIQLLSGGSIVFLGNYAFQAGNIPDANHIVNAATFATGPIAPGEMISIFGTGIGPATGVGAQLNAAGTTVANNVAQTRVLFGTTASPLLFVSSGQVNCVVPYEVAGNATTNVMIQYLGNNTNAVAVPVGQTSPGIFVISAAGVTPQQGAILNQDSSINGATNPAATGSVIQIYATGEGVTNPASTDGALAQGTTFPAPFAPVSVTIGGVAANIAFAGTAPGGVAGFLQVNAVVPAGVASGAQPIVLTVGPNSSPAGPTVAIQ